MVLIDQETAGLLGGLYDLGEPRKVDLKGIGPTEVRRLGPPKHG